MDVHCDDDEYCDYPDGGEGLCQVGCRNGAVCGDNVKPCGKCVDHECTGEPECCSDADCTEVSFCIIPGSGSPDTGLGQKVL